MNPVISHYIHATALMIAMFVTAFICSKAMIMYNQSKDLLLSLFLGAGMLITFTAGGFFTITLMVALFSGVPSP